MAGSAVLLLGVLYVRLYPALLIAVTVVGAISQLHRPASAALLAEYTPRHRQVMVFAMYRLALNLGTTAAPVIGAAPACRHLQPAVLGRTSSPCCSTRPSTCSTSARCHWPCATPARTPFVTASWLR